MRSYSRTWVLGILVLVAAVWMLGTPAAAQQAAPAPAPAAAPPPAAPPAPPGPRAVLRRNGPTAERPGHDHAELHHHGGHQYPVDPVGLQLGLRAGRRRAD